MTIAERELGSHTIQKVLSSIPGLRQVNLGSEVKHSAPTGNISGVDTGNKLSLELISTIKDCRVKVTSQIENGNLLFWSKIN